VGKEGSTLEVHAGSINPTNYYARNQNEQFETFFYKNVAPVCRQKLEFLHDPINLAFAVQTRIPMQEAGRGIRHSDETMELSIMPFYGASHNNKPIPSF